MPATKAKTWKSTKAKKLWDKYNNNGTTMPKYKAKRDESPNTAAKRKALKEEMKARNMGQKVSSSGKYNGNKFDDFLKRQQEINRRKYEEEKELYLNMNHRQRNDILRAAKREKWARENGPKCSKEDEGNSKKESEAKKEEDQEKQNEEEKRRKHEENQKKQEEERKKREEEQRKREEEQRKQDENRRKQEEQKKKKNRKIYEKLPTGEYCVDVMELGEDQTWENVRRKYRELCLRYHPDKRGDGEKFKKMKQAYDRLEIYFNKK